MGVNYNPRVVTNGLVLALDAGNASKSAKGFKNLLNLSTWTLGTGSVTGFTQNGLTTENQRILDTGPFGSTVVWDTPSNDATSNDDGGYNSAAIPIDPTKLYRFSVWMRRKTIGDGYSYMGCHAWDVTAQQVLNRVDGALNQNPYFSSFVWPTSNVPAGSWMLIVGHIFPAGSGTGANHPDSGLWNSAGVKFSNPSGAGDFVWQSTNTYTIHRSYLYYSTDTTTNQQWYQPRIDLVDGTQPTIAELISGVGSKWYDLAGTNHSLFLNSAAPYNTNGFIQFDGTNAYTSTGLTLSASEFSIHSLETVAKRSGTASETIVWGWQGFNCGILMQSNAINASNWYSNGSGGWLNTLASSGITAQVDTWYHIVLTFNATGFMRIYVNGVNYASTDVSGFNTSSSNVWYRAPLTFGGFTFAGYRFPGSIALGKLYSRELSAAEIRQNFNAVRGRFGI